MEAARAPISNPSRKGSCSSRRAGDSPATGKPNLLYISPTIPAMTGNGLAMRAGMILEALAADYQVYLLVIPVFGRPPREGVHSSVSGWCAEIALHDVSGRVDPLFNLIARIRDPGERLAAQARYPKPALCRFATTDSIREAAKVYRDIPFREVHVFRLYMAPFAGPYLPAGPGARPGCRLDLDDLESRTRLRLAALYEANGDKASASLERSESQAYAAMERACLPLFDRVYVCSEGDRQELIRRQESSHITVIPNGVRIPAAQPAGRTARPFTFLFVGSLGYYPNEDAVLWFCTEILPRIRAKVRRPFRVLIVGTHPSRRILSLSAGPEVRVTGTVRDLAGYYRDADLVVIPLRAGGGTRIKVLEAFSYRRPVVSTVLGAEGIDVHHGKHLLLADTPGEFAGQCVRLMESPAVRDKLAERAFEFVRAHHSPEKIQELLRRDHGWACEQQR